MQLKLVCLPLASVLCGIAVANDQLVVRIAPSRVLKLDATTGAVIDPNYIDIDTLLGFGGAFRETRDGVVPGNGEIWISNASADVLHRFTEDGSTYLGDIQTGNCVGMEIANNHLWVVETSGPAGSALVQYEMTNFTVVGSVAIADPRDVLLYNGTLLVSQFNDGPIVSVDPATGTLIGNFSAPGGLNYQMSELASGNLLVARWGPPGLHVLNAAGGVVQTMALGFGLPEGVAELGNGKYLVSSQQGIYSWDPATATASQLDPSPALFIFEAPVLTPPPTSYCTAGTSTNGCNAIITANHNPSVSQANPCSLSVTDVEGQKGAIVFYGLLPLAQPWSPTSTSFLCVKPPTQRTPNQNSGGTLGACDGALAFDWNAFQNANPTALGNPWSAGDNVYCQAWYRDPPAPKTTNLSNALCLTYVP